MGFVHCDRMIQNNVRRKELSKRTQCIFFFKSLTFFFQKVKNVSDIFMQLSFISSLALSREKNKTFVSEININILNILKKRKKRKNERRKIPSFPSAFALWSLSLLSLSLSSEVRIFVWFCNNNFVIN